MKDQAAAERQQTTKRRPHRLASTGLRTDELALLGLQRSAGNSAVSSALAKSTDGNRAENATTVQRKGGPGTAVAPKPPVVAETRKLPAAEKSDDVLARGLVEDELAILRQWKYALDAFNEVLKSESDKAAKPDFQKTVVKFFSEKIVGRLVEDSKVAGMAFELFGKLTEEVERAKKAQESGRIRDFFVQHNAAIANLDQKLSEIKDDFETAVQQSAERAMSGDQKALDDYGMMRMHLVEAFQDAKERLQSSNWSQLYTVLSEEWIRASSTYTGMGMHEAARVVIRINQNFGIIDAYIRGSGGQKIAEQLLKNSPAGVDVFALKVPRYIKYFDLRKNDWPAAMFGLDVSNNPQDIGSYAAGHWEPIYSRLMQSGLPLTTKLEGEE